MPNKYSYAHVLSQLESQGRLDPNHRSHSRYLESWYDSGPDSPRSESVDTSSSSSEPSAAPPSLSLSQSSPDTDSLYSIESTGSRTADSIVTQIYAPQPPATPPAIEHAPLRSPPLRPFPNYTRRDSTPQYIGRSPTSSSQSYSPRPPRPGLSHSTTPPAPFLLPSSTERTPISPLFSPTSKRHYAEPTFTHSQPTFTHSEPSFSDPEPSFTDSEPSFTDAESMFTNDSYFANFPFTGSFSPSQSSLKTDAASTYTTDSYFATLSLPGTLTPLSQELDSRINPWDDLPHLPSTFRMHPPPPPPPPPSPPPSPAPPPRLRRPAPISRTRPSEHPLAPQSPYRSSPSSKDSTPKAHRLPFLKLSAPQPKPRHAPTPSQSTVVASLPPTTSSTKAGDGWVASTYRVEGMSEKELERLRRKGVNPALRAEMRAARRGKGGVPVSVGNTFIG
ncbi:MAG: hypothetical protein FRX48_05926 [Lasallia pustulata]|uniref:Uncharacterized protein n=1 Tax=Lasallia pustulata TaxID=136370 RepID=A0A5M8PP94_9LECA|nr:MAG: hypothetical protein FRX48_05926 [Lasallia pustulata]